MFSLQITNVRTPSESIYFAVVAIIATPDICFEQYPVAPTGCHQPHSPLILYSLFSDAQPVRCHRGGCFFLSLRFNPCRVQLQKNNETVQTQSTSYELATLNPEWKTNLGCVPSHPTSSIPIPNHRVRSASGGVRVQLSHGVENLGSREKLRVFVHSVKRGLAQSFIVFLFSYKVLNPPTRAARDRAVAVHSSAEYLGSAWGRGGGERCRPRVIGSEGVVPVLPRRRQCCREEA